MRRIRDVVCPHKLKKTSKVVCKYVLVPILKCGLVTMLFLFVLLLSGCSEPVNYDSFAKCLTEKGVELYGSNNCPHCKNVKNDFGNSFKFLNYTECNPTAFGGNTEKCRDEQIKYLPTFKFADESVLTGELKFKILSEKVGCPLP